MTYKQITLSDGNRVWVDTESKIEQIDLILENPPFTLVDGLAVKIVATVSPYHLAQMPQIEERKLTAETYIKENYPSYDFNNEFDRVISRFSFNDLIGEMEDYHTLRSSLIALVTEEDIEREALECSKEYDSRGAYYSFKDGVKFIQQNGGYSEEQMRWVNLYDRPPIGETGTIVPALSGEPNDADFYTELIILDGMWRIGDKTFPFGFAILKNFYWLEQIKPSPRTLTETELKQKWYWVL